MRKENLLDCPALLRDFLYYMETIRGRSARTVDGYYIDLRLFLRYIKAVKLLELTEFQPDDITIGDITPQLICEVTRTDIYAYLSYTLSQRENNAATRARKVSSIRSFYNYITTKTDLLETSPAKDLDMPTVKAALPKFLSLEESIDLLSAAADANDPRDYCIITLLINCGMRVSELVGINITDIRRQDKTLRLLGKGNKERIIYVNTACLNALDAYEPVRSQILAQRKRKDEPALFLSSRTGNRLTARRVEQLLEKYLAAAGLAGRGYSPHKLRHTAATLMYQHGGVDVRVLKEILGHENLSTTEIYTHVSNRQMEHAAESSPLARFEKKAAQPEQTQDEPAEPVELAELLELQPDTSPL